MNTTFIFDLKNYFLKMPLPKIDGSTQELCSLNTMSASILFYFLFMFSTFISSPKVDHYNVFVLSDDSE